MDLRSGSEFSRLYDDEYASVYTAAMRIVGSPALAQDVTHDVFLRIWRRPEAFDRSRGDIGTFLRVMARSRALDLWRETQAAGRATDRLRRTAGTEEARPEERPAPAVERAEHREFVRAALRRLPDPQREALVLAYWGGLSAEQISHESGIPLGTAKSRIRLGLAKLRDDRALVSSRA